MKLWKNPAIFFVQIKDNLASLVYPARAAVDQRGGPRGGGGQKERSKQKQQF